MAGIDVMAVVKPELAQAIKKNLCDPAKMHIWQDYRQQIINIVSQIRKQRSLNAQISKKYVDAFNQLFGESGLTAIKTVATQQKTMTMRLKALIMQLFQLEHKIMKVLSDGMADTSEYVIYYSDGSNGISEVTRAVIPAEELYNSGALTISKSGIMLKHENVAALLTEDNSSKLSTQQQETYAKIVEVAMQDMLEAQKKLQHELRGIEKKMHQEHLGEALYTRYQRLGKFLSFSKGENSTAYAGLYARYMVQKSYTSLRGAFFNRGHLFEALERYISGDNNALIDVFGESLGRDPWWTGGDVQMQTADGWINKQVKALLKDDQSISPPEVQIAAFDSIIDLASALLELLNMQEDALKNSTQFLEAKISGQTSTTNSTIGIRLSQTIDRLLAARFSG